MVKNNSKIEHPSLLTPHSSLLTPVKDKVAIKMRLR
jgi:hypothetical protein